MKQKRKASAEFTRGERSTWKWKASFVNDDSSAIRVCFDNVARKDVFLVVKLIFDDDCQVTARTIKFWWGDYQRTVDSWNTNIPYDLDDEDIEEIKQTMSGFNKAVGANLFLMFVDDQKVRGGQRVNDKSGDSASPSSNLKGGPSDE